MDSIFKLPEPTVHLHPVDMRNAPFVYMASYTLIDSVEPDITATLSTRPEMRTRLLVARYIGLRVHRAAQTQYRYSMHVH